MERPPPAAQRGEALIVRPERAGEEGAIGALIDAAFGGPAEAHLVEQLRRDGEVTLSIVAEEEGVIVGHVLFSALRAPAASLALAPLSVAPSRQRAGIGSTLVRDGLARLRDAGWSAVFVLGEPAYYTRLGFTREAAAAFETPYPKEYFLALELVPRGLAGKSGPVTYAPAFAGLG